MRGVVFSPPDAFEDSLVEALLFFGLAAGVDLSEVVGFGLRSLSDGDENGGGDGGGDGGDDGGDTGSTG